MPSTNGVIPTLRNKCKYPNLTFCVFISKQTVKYLPEPFKNDYNTLEMVMVRNVNEWGCSSPTDPTLDLDLLTIILTLIFANKNCFNRNQTSLQYRIIIDRYLHISCLYLDKFTPVSALIPQKLIKSLGFMHVNPI
jgi:hypothetical protein